MPQLKSAIEKIELNQSSSDVKLTADEIYSQTNMFDEWRVKYIEYLCMRLIELPKSEQQSVLFNYIRLVKNLSRGMWSPEDKSEVVAEKLLELAFDDANVRLKLANLGDKKRRKPKKKSRTKLADTPQTLSDKIINWFKKDLKKKYRWES